MQTTPNPSSQQQGGARIIGSTDTFDEASGPGPYLMLADSLEGNDVVNAEGDDLGHIKGIMLDVQRGRIAYAVLSFGGFLGVGNKLFAIPWQALTLDTDEKQFVLNVSEDRLKNAPGFDKDHWPSMADLSWADEVHRYYGTEPYWH
ncbi:MAG TPA: PRC-barrel domain-containing protein [Chitinolyticbacter sp.]|uniref:PRC-barrel domain-containing protein n=1 Tax=Chitinolyticbacter albus TaxID=2961951 RepID=UPI00210F2137|nr:PRC-barrel domain-containing protein [Chitinolyticbacter albus]HSC81895.1 PRC-barrel domain-containing protein [Chitinolyticbacter sp.]